MSTAEKLARFNLWMTFLWIALTPPSVLFWSESILWVIVISLWANIVGHFSAYLASRTEIAQEQGHNLTKQDREWLTHQMKLSFESEPNIVITPPTADILTSPPPASTDIMAIAKALLEKTD